MPVDVHELWLPPCAKILEPSSDPNSAPVHLRLVNPITSPDDILHAARQDDPDFHKYQLWTQYTTTIESAKVRVNRYCADILSGNALIYDMLQGPADDPGAHIGLAGLTKSLSVGPPTAEAGYWLVKEARGKRYMSRAMRCIIGYAANEYWPDLTGVNFYIAQGNAASEYVATASGAQWESKIIVGAPQSEQGWQANIWTIKL